MNVRNMKTIIEWIGKTGFKVIGDDAVLLKKAELEIARGYIEPDTFHKVQNLYKKASGGGEHQRRQYLGR